MYKKKRLNSAVLFGIAASLSTASANAQNVIEEVIVTATKREESAQDIPVTVLALDESTMKELQIGNFDDYVSYMPNVTNAGRGPGQSSIYIRGMATSTISVQLAGANGSAPNVALYLDEQPVTIVGRNLDVYVTDMERIEVLPGPQGTLFGSSSMAGTVRLITNKPVLNEFQSGIQARLASTSGGDLSHSIEGYFNLPLIDNKFAARIAFYNVNLGGYVDNVPGEKQISLDNPGFSPDDNPDREIAFNTRFVKNDFNDSAYLGARIGAEYLINDDWGFLLQYSQQKLTADGVFDYDPEIGDLEVRRYFPDDLEDEFQQVAWTLDGRLAALDVIYTGAYLDREVEQLIDYTGYSDTGPFIPYYICEYPGYASCSAPDLGVQVHSKFTRQSHEFRFNTPADKSLRATAGLFYEDTKLEEIGDFVYTGTIEQGFARNAPLPDATSINPNPRMSGVAFFNDVTRTEEQIALFGELTYDFSEKFSGTLGLRWYDLEVDLVGSSNFANRGPVDLDFGSNLDQKFEPFAPFSENDVIPKISFSYTPTDNTLYYLLYSEGFRPGGFNRGGGDSMNDIDFVPFTYGTDSIKNYELGWKTMLLNQTLQFNGAAYYVDWSDMQVARFDPINLSILTFIENAASSEIKGIESDIVWLPTKNLSIFAAVSVNDSELTETPPGIIDLAPAGSELALAPPIQGSIRGRFDWHVDDYIPYVQAGVRYTAKAWSSIVAEERFRQDSYTIVDVSAGLTKNSWLIELFVTNLTDKRAQMFINTQDKDKRTATNRPRTIGLRLTYDW